MPHIRLCKILIFLSMATLIFSGSVRGALPRFESELDLTVGGEAVNIEHWESTVSDTGEIVYKKVTDSGFYKRTAFDGDLRILHDVRDNMVLDLRSQWNGALFDPQIIKAERYDVVYGDTELKLGYGASDKSLWMARIFHRLDKEDLLPYVNANTFGAEGGLDRSLGDHTFVNGKAGFQETTFSGSESRWDNTEAYFRISYTNIGPERTSVDGLPFHPDRYTPDPQMYFAHSEMLGLWKSRPVIGRDGNARRILDTIPMAPPPPTQDLKMNVNIPGSTFAAGLGFTSRDYSNLNNQSFLRADGSVFIKWSLANRLTLTLDENLYWQDYTFEDDANLLYDHLKNDLNLYLNYSTQKQYVSLGASAKHLFFDEATVWDLATTKLYGTWDYQQSRKYSYSARASYQRDIPDDKRPYNEYTKDLFLFGAFRLHFDNRTFLRFSLEREKEIVTQAQSQFDSSFDTNKYEIRLQKNINSQLTWQAGYSFERERHEFFYKNNLDEEIGYVNLCVHI